jgi:hypothetical protein
MLALSLAMAATKAPDTKLTSAHSAIPKVEGVNFAVAVFAF